jgi:cell surface protein SprA
LSLSRKCLRKQSWQKLTFNSGIIRICVFTILLWLCVGVAYGQNNRDSLHYPLEDRYGDPLSNPQNNPFYLPDSSFIKQDIEFDPATNEYYIIEKVGDTYYRKPTYLSYDEFWALEDQKQEDDYFNQRSQTLDMLNRQVIRPPMQVYKSLFDRIFGVGPNGLKVDIKPQGTVDLTMGYQGQNIDNPTLPEAARKTGGFDFNENANLSVIANIGDKLKLPINYNTLANFDFQNQLKLDYRGKDDEIIKSIQAGNISFQTKGTLMASVQSLFGISTQLQFGKLFVTTTLAEQRSQTQSLTLQGGGVSQNINMKMDAYDVNRNFLLGQYFVHTYDSTMKNLPIVSTQVQIMRLEVWITNRTGVTTNAREVSGYMDLGESQPYNPANIGLAINPLPDNGDNSLYSFLASDPNNRNPGLTNALMIAHGLKPVNDYEITYARKLDSSEYYFNPQAGFISLNQQLQPTDVLAVAYQYTYNGRVYQVGEFSQDVALDTAAGYQGVQKVLFLKLLKATSSNVSLPIWQLMMKNIYSLNVSGLQQQKFNLNVFYQQPGGGQNIYLPESAPNVSGKTLLSILNLDRLNNQNDPQPDGKWDFVNGFTVLAQQGKIIFPELYPFGKDLDTLAFAGQPQELKNQYLYYQLYDSIQAIAQTYLNVDRFVVQGTVEGTSSSNISLGAFNIPPGSVIVTANGQTLTENVDYAIDYNLGTITILNQAILNSGVPVNVQFENNATYGIQNRSFLGMRVDYIANKNLSIGATLERLKELPFFTKVNYGEEPIDNTMYGVDFNYNSDFPVLTRILNELPFYNTTTPSHITAYGEAAALKPGHAPQIGSGSQGLIYIDDFEGSTTDIDMRFPWTSWVLASTPSAFPESQNSNQLSYGYNRARLAWYNIDPTLQDPTNSTNPLASNLQGLSDPRVRAVYTNELFPQETTDITDALLTTFDVAYYPTDRGPYNFVSDQADVLPTGKLTNPQNRWGGIMRSISQTDFETDNVQYMEFWVQDPFITQERNGTVSSTTKGKLMIDLGSVSEDVLKDGRRFYENGMNAPDQPSSVDSITSVWGTVPLNPISVVFAFSNDPNDRAYQDVGFDGMNDNSERRKQSKYLASVATNFGNASAFYQNAFTDPSNDDYVWYRDAGYNATNTGILGRYKKYNNPEGNSPVVSATSALSPASTLYPDVEDLDNDNTLNQTEQYYEYEVDLQAGMTAATSPFIVQTQVVTPTLVDGAKTQETWYLFRVPINSYSTNVGNVPDFQSIRYMRMYMTGFQDSVVLRFATFNLVRNAWRTFTYNIDTTGIYTPLPVNSPTTLNVAAVNVEANSARLPIPYQIPPGIERVQYLSNNGVNLLQNEQSMSLKIANLANGDSRGVFKNFNLDLRQYGELSMFIHAESVTGQVPVLDSQLVAVVRLGSDFISNYYEIRIPLAITLPNPSATPAEVWPTNNNLDFELSELVNLKLQRDRTDTSFMSLFSQKIGNKIFSVFGNPNLAQLQGILISVENVSGKTISSEVWVDELRLSQIDEQGGWAALGKVNIQLADLGSLSVSANTYTYGFGTIQQDVSQRALTDMAQFDVATNLDAGKLFPKKANFSIPFYASIDRTVLTPHYDPYDQDVLLSYKLSAAASKAAQDSIRETALDQTTIKTFNFTNVKFAKAPRRPKLWSLSNFDFSYSYTEIAQSNPQIIENNIKKYQGGFGYTFNGTEKYLQPFKKAIRNKSHWFDLVRDFNLNLTPSLIGFRTVINRQFGIYVPRIVNTYNNTVTQTDTTYDKFFTWDRYYNLRWDLTHSVNFDFSATNSSRIDEPAGLINTTAKKDTVLSNFEKGGRNTLYQQQATFSYNAPLSKLPITDWITARYNYTTSYNWIGASLLAVSFGNTLENSQQNGLNGEFDFARLYNKSKLLSQANSPTPSKASAPNGADSLGAIPPRDSVIKGLSGFAKRNALRKWRLRKRNAREAERKANFNKPIEMPGLERTGLQLLTMVKRVSVNYSSTYNSRVPGYMDSTRFIGQDWSSMEPGLGYVFGKQPDTGWLDKKAAQGLITRDSTFNLFYEQNLTQQLTLSAQLMPIKNLTIDLNMMKSFQKDYTELFKDTLGSGSGFQHLSPLTTGGFSVSYMSISTLFGKYNPNVVSQTFLTFQNNRIIIANRLAALNPYWQAFPQNMKYTSDGFPTGYGRYAQDVLIPAFLAAYTGKDPYNIALVNETNPNINSNPFNGYKPVPNWRMSYNGLITAFPSLAKTFSSITITNAYDATLSMNSFSSALNYLDPFHLSTPGFIDTTSGNFVPYYLVPNITVTEEFSPLIGIDVTTVNQTNLNFSYKKSRQLSMSLLTYQLSEVTSNGWTLGGSIRKKGVNLPFRLPGFKKLDPKGNTLNIGLNLGVQNDTQSNSNLDQSNAYSTGGQKVITIQPSVDYVLNKRVDLKLYFDQQRIIPYISTSAPVTNTRAGIDIKVSLQ